MGKVFTNLPLLSVIAVLVSGASIYADIGHVSFAWFQRSGSFLVLIGAVLSYRSVVRLGVDGVGGPASPTIVKGTLLESYEGEDGRLMSKIQYDEKTVKWMAEVFFDKLSGYIGAFFIVFGTTIWGYGDLLGRLF